MNTLRLRAEHSAQKFYNKRQNEPIEALAGDGAGNVDVTGRLNWIWVRIDGNVEAVTVAFNKSGHEFAEDDSIQIRWVKRTGLGYYEVTGYSGSALYDNPSDTTQTTVRAHAAQHERRDAGAGGFDPLDIYARMVVPLRARPQTSPDLTLHVEAGYNPLTGNYYAGGDSAAFTAPVGLAQAKIDLLYLGSDDALHIVAGTPVAGGSPTLPAMVLPSVPLAFVYLAYGQTTITESNIYRDPGILRAPVGSATTAGHTIQDEGTPRTQRTNLNFVGAGVTATDDAGNNATKVTIPGNYLLLDTSNDPLTAQLHIQADDPLVGGLGPPIEQLLIENPATPGSIWAQANIAFKIYNGTTHKVIGWVGVTGGSYTYAPYANATYLENFDSGGVRILSDDPVNGVIGMYTGGYVDDTFLRLLISAAGAIRQYGNTFLDKPLLLAGIGLDPNSATGDYQVYLSPANLTGNRRATFPNKTGTVAYLDDIAAANPTAEVGPTAANGSAATFMRSDAAPKLADTAVAPGTYGDSSHVAQVTIDQQGRITGASSVALPPGSGKYRQWLFSAVGGDLTILTDVDGNPLTGLCDLE